MQLIRIWLSTPVGIWHYARTPEYDYSQMTPEQARLVLAKWHSWYSADWDYSLATVYLFCVSVAFFGLINIVFRLRQRAGTADTVRKLPGYGTVVAFSRALGARQLRVSALEYYSPPLSAVVIVLGMLVFFTVLTFAAHPYIWPNPAMGESPPLATRTGWTSLAIMPFSIALATKLNYIGAITGLSHEKLQVFHRWTAWAMYVTALIHTFMYIVRQFDAGTMMDTWMMDHYYWTGVLALVPQTWLMFLSVGPIRNRFYEFFKKLHFVAAGAFVVGLWLHCDWILTSWDYVWATIAIYMSSWFIRHGRAFFRGGAPLTIEALPDNMVKITIPTTADWKPGQHFFARFLDLGIHAATSHPFTAASLCVPAEKDGMRTVELYARARGGITARLDALVRAGSLKTSRVVLDGPYGGVEGNLAAYDRVLLLGGGSGVTFVIPLLLDLVRSFVPGGTKCTRVELVWAVRSEAALAWFADALATAVKNAPEGLSVSVSCYVTDGKSTAAADEADDASVHKQGAVERHTGRPDLPDVVKTFCSESGTVAIATCGPDSFNFDVGTAVSGCELDIVAGKSACSEIYLHHESYGW